MPCNGVKLPLGNFSKVSFIHITKSKCYVKRNLVIDIDETFKLLFKYEPLDEEYICE